MSLGLSRLNSNQATRVSRIDISLIEFFFSKEAIRLIRALTVSMAIRVIRLTRVIRIARVIRAIGAILVIIRVILS